MSGSSVPISEPVPSCTKCESPMVRRTARRGPNVGREFWGCSEFPRCRGVVQDEPPADAPTDQHASPPDQRIQHSADETTESDVSDKSGGFLTKVSKTVDKGWRWYLESDEPDASGRWDDAHRRRVLSYIHGRDDGRCGLCAGEMKLKGAQIEHVVPKVFAVFDVRKGKKAEPGTRYKSRLHNVGARAQSQQANGSAPSTPDALAPALHLGPASAAKRRLASSRLRGAAGREVRTGAERAGSRIVRSVGDRCS